MSELPIVSMTVDVFCQLTNQETPGLERGLPPRGLDIFRGKNAPLASNHGSPSLSIPYPDEQVELYTTDPEEQELKKSPNGTNKYSWSDSVSESSPSGSEWSMDINAESNRTSSCFVEEQGGSGFTLRPVTEKDWRR